MDRVGVDEAVVGYPTGDWTDDWHTLQAAAAYDRLYGTVLVDPFADDAVDRCMATDGVRPGAACPRDAMWGRFDPTVTWLTGMSFRRHVELA